MAKKKNKIGTIIAVLAILTIFPIVTYYSLYSGLEFRRGISKNIMTKDSLAAYEMYSLPDSTMKTMEELGQVRYIVAVKKPEHDSTSFSVGGIAYNALQEFSDRIELAYLIYSPGFNDVDVDMMEELKREGAVELLTSSSPILQNTWPDSLQNNLALALIDRKSRVLNYYDAEDSASVTSLVEFLSVILPDEPMFKRRYRSGR